MRLRARARKGPLFVLGLGLLLGVAGAARAQTLPIGYANKAGFPKTLPAGTGAGNGYPVWADLGLRGGRKSLVFTTWNHQLFVVDYDGTVAPGWPVTLPSQANTPTVADLDGDGIPEILVGFGGQNDYAASGGVGGVQAYRRTGGAPMWTVNSFNEPANSLPARRRVGPGRRGRGRRWPRRGRLGRLRRTHLRRGRRDRQRQAGLAYLRP